MRVLSWWYPVVPCIHVVLVCLSLAQASLVWVSKPQNRAVALGQDLVLPCLAKMANVSDTLTVLSYTWQLNGGNVTSKASRFYNNSLFISRISSEELGNYSCVVTSKQQTTAGQSGTFVEVLTGMAIIIEAYIHPFVIHPLPLEAAIGEVCTLTCVTGISAPTVQVWWLREGKIFTEGEIQTAAFGDYDTTGLSVQLSVKLTFKISAEIFGSFECVAFNDVANEKVHSKQANVTNRVIKSDTLPVIEWSLPVSLIVSDGQRLILPCKVKESTEPAAVYWNIGSYRVDESKRLYVLPNKSLGFYPVGLKDSGNYSCVAENSKGITRSPYVEMIVAFLGFSFRINPSSSYAIYGQDVILKCEPPDSIPPAAIIWYKDYAPIDLQSARVKVVGSNLHLVSVMKVDNGIYYCVAFNNLTMPTSRASNVARLTVEGPPIMIQPPINTKMTRGKLLHLTCFVDADPSPITAWQFEGMPLPSGGKVLVTNRGQELFITNVGKEWEGRYTCLSRNKFGDTSAEAFVTVLVPPVSLQPIGDLVVKSGDSVLILCPIIGSPKPGIQWFFDGVSVSVNGSVASILNANWTFRSPDLYIANAQKQHAGNYSCIGSNDAGNASASGALIVLVPPVITKAPEETAAVIGMSVTLNCEAEGSPVPSMQWLYNSTAQLPEHLSLMDANRTLEIPAMNWGSVGVYTCIAHNLAGAMQASAAVALTIPPEIENIQFPIRPVRIETEFRLSCIVSGIPTPTVLWYHFDKLVLPSLDGRVRIPDMGVLIVEFARRNDSGQYECVADSDFGLQRKMVSVVVYGPPSPPVLLRVAAASDKSVYLFWKWLDYGDAAQIVEKFQIYFREKTRDVVSIYPRLPVKNETSAELFGLQPATEYIFYISAVNDAGVGLPSNALSTFTLQSKPSPPANLQPSSLTSTSVILSWEIPILPNGLVRMYQLRYKRINETAQDYISVNITNPHFLSNDILLSPLLPYSSYYAEVCACNIERGQNLCGDYSSVTFHTLASKPSLPPQFISIETLDPYSLRVAWQHIPVLAQNGPLQYYIVFISNESQSLNSARVESSMTTYAIRGLFPWRVYSVTLAGQNEAGLSPLSDPVRARTLPIAPVAPPDNFQASANISSTIQLYWKAPPAGLITCNITAYIVEYRKKGSSTWISTSVVSSLSKSSYSYVLKSLSPWTWYECKVAAFSDTLNPGTGPFTDSVLVRTLQGVSSPVTYLSYTSNYTHILLSWQPPKDVKGVLIGYRVIYEAVGNGHMPLTMEINSTHTAVALENLSVDTLYNVSVAAVNAAGSGTELVLMVRTLSLQPDNFLPTTTNTTLNMTDSNKTEYSLGQNDGSHITKNLASIVAGSIVGAIALVIVAVFICMKCMKYRQKQRLNYVVGDESVGVEGTSYRSLEPSSDIVIISSSKSYEVISPQSSSSSVIQSSNTNHHHRALHEDHRTKENVDRKKNKKNSSGKEEKRRHSLPRISVPILSLTSSSYSMLQEDQAYLDVNANEEVNGIDNPGFIAISVEPAAGVQTEVNPRPLRDSHHLSVASDDAVSVSSDSLRRRNRMHSENAAAIAVLRSNQIVIPDDDFLMDCESISTEVIFNERTVL